MGDDLLALEGGIEVWEDANLPGAARRKPKRLGRRLGLAAGAERAALELVGVGRRLEVREGSGSERAARRDDNRSAGQGIAAQLGRRAVQLGPLAFSAFSAFSASERSRNGRIRSTGAGKTIVELFDEPISSRVWR